MARYLALFGIFTAFSTSCASDADLEGVDGAYGVLRVGVDTDDLDPSRVRIGLFESNSPCSFWTADGIHGWHGSTPIERRDGRSGHDHGCR